MSLGDYICTTTSSWSIWLLFTGCDRLQCSLGIAVSVPVVPYLAIRMYQPDQKSNAVSEIQRPHDVIFDRIVDDIPGLKHFVKRHGN